MKIKICNLIKTAFSADDAEKIASAIQPVIASEECIELDFEEISIFTTLFFNHLIANYVLKNGPEVFEAKFSLVNLTELGKTTYAHSLENATKYYMLTLEEKNTQQKIVNEPEI